MSVRWTTHDKATYEELEAIEKRLVDLLTTPDSYATSADGPAHHHVADENEAADVIRNARRGLMILLLAQETHEHWGDDCGDDLQAATDAWIELFFRAYFDNDGTDMVKEVNAAVDRLNEMYGREEEV